LGAAALAAPAFAGVGTRDEMDVPTMMTRLRQAAGLTA
jgi:hypothetical protein